MTHKPFVIVEFVDNRYIVLMQDMKGKIHQFEKSTLLSANNLARQLREAMAKVMQ